MPNHSDRRPISFALRLLAGVAIAGSAIVSHAQENSAAVSVPLILKFQNSER
jgi:hypothetical protein